MVKFLSEEWVALAKQRVLDELDPLKDLKSVSGSFLLIVSNIPPSGTTMSWYLSVTNGRLSNMVLDQGVSSNSTAEFTAMGNYETFTQIMKGEMSIVVALIKNRVQFKGDMLKAYGFIHPIDKIIECLRKISTEF